MNLLIDTSKTMFVYVHKSLRLEICIRDTHYQEKMGNYVPV